MCALKDCDHSSQVPTAKLLPALRNGSLCYEVKYMQAVDLYKIFPLDLCDVVIVEF